MATDDLALRSGAAELGVALSDGQIQQFARYAELILEWNQRMNLTRIPPEEFVPLHFLDSLAVRAALDSEPSGKLIDVGTGAGFPGIPLKIAFPRIRLVLLDSTRKRLSFLDEVIGELGLTDTVTIHGRAEDMCRSPEHRLRYDLAAARAVAPMLKLAGWLLPFVRRGGFAVALKSRDVVEEIAEAGDAIRRLGGRIERIAPVRIPGTEIERRIVVIRKMPGD